MRFYYFLRCVFLTFGLAGLIFSEMISAGESQFEVVVITSPTASQTTVSQSTLRAIYSMRMHKWPDGTPVKVFVLRDGSPDHIMFSKSVLQVFPHQLRQAWDKQVFSGLGQYPEQVDSAKEMLAKVAATPGAVGYIKLIEVNQNVRILEVH
jgi:ABC-type phosphate transport system substrate-binding protein